MTAKTSSRQSRILLALIGAMATVAVLLASCIGVLLVRAAVNRQLTEVVPPHPPLFDLEALGGLWIDEGSKVLGPPADKEPEPTTLQIKLGIDEWSNEFEKDDRQLL